MKNLIPPPRKRLSSYNFSTDCTAVKESSGSRKQEARARREMLSGLRTFLMILGFSVHNLFEGMAVGLEGSRRGVWQMFAAIIIHSAAVMFCIGTELLISGSTLWRLVIYIMMVSVVSPAGVMVSAAAITSQPLVVGTMQGLAAGAMLYVTFFEVRIISDLMMRPLTVSLSYSKLLFQVLSRARLTKFGMSGLLGTLIVILAFSVMAAVSSAGGGHSGHSGHRGLQAGHHHHQGGVTKLMGESFQNLHSRFNYERYESDSDVHSHEYDLVFDYDNLHHGDHHEHGGGHQHA